MYMHAFYYLPVNKSATDLESYAIAQNISPNKISIVPAIIGCLKLLLLHQLNKIAKLNDATGVIAKTFPEDAQLIPKASVYKFAVGANR